MLKLTILLFISMQLLSCGQEVTLTNNKLERWNSLAIPELKADQEGLLIRGNQLDHIQIASQSLKVSTYSSHQAKSFINSLPVGSQTPVKFKGKIVSGEIQLEIIERK
jgi:hypothetical protein